MHEIFQIVCYSCKYSPYKQILILMDSYVRPFLIINYLCFLLFELVFCVIFKIKLLNIF